MDLTTDTSTKPAFEASAAAGTPPRSRSTVIAALGLVCLGLLAVVGVFWETSTSLVGSWDRTSAYKHGYLIAPISAYLIWERRAVFAHLPFAPCLWGLALMPLFGATWLAADTVDVTVVKHLALIGMFQAVLLTGLGWRLYKSLLFPILYLGLMLPAGTFLLAPLQDIAAFLTIEMLQWTPIPVYGEDTIVSVPTGTYRIAPECAGLNFVLASLAFSLLYSNLMYRSAAKRVICIVAMIGMAILANGIRIVGIIIVAHITERQLGIVDDHIIYGWGFFAVILLLMMWAGLRWREPDPDHGAEAGAVAAGTPMRATRLAWVAGAVAVVVGLAALPPAYAQFVRDGGAPATALSLEIAFDAAGWRQVESSGDWEPSVPGAEARDTVSFMRDGVVVDLTIAYVQRQRDGRELIGGRNSMAGSNDRWVRIAGRGARAVLGGVPVRLRETRLRQYNQIRLVWSFYWIDGEFTASGIVGKLRQAKAELLGGERRAALIALSALGNPDDESARAAMKDLLAGLETLPAWLEAVGER